MGLGLMAAEIARDLEKQVERELEEKHRKYIQSDNQYDIYNENISYDSIIKAEKQFSSMVEKLSKELNKNIHMLQTHKPVVNLNLTINIMGCENSEETADAVESRVVKLVDILK